jgi:pimeloyl-ACP methyl ester carboxylesterase
MNPRLTALLLASLVGSGIAGCRAEGAPGQSQPVAAEVVAPDRVSIVAPDPDRLCRFNSVALSPSGSFAVFSAAPEVGASFKGMDELVVADIDCVLRNDGFKGCLTDAYAPAGVRPLAWSRTERSLFLIEASKALVRLEIEPAEQPMGAMSERADLARDIAETAVYMGPTTSETNAAELARLTNALKSGRASGQLTLLGLHMGQQGLLGATYEERPSLRLMASVGAGEPYAVGLTAPYAAHWSLAPNPKGRLMFSAMGYQATLYGGRWRALKVAPYQLPLSDPASGQLVGRQNERTAELDGDAEVHAKDEASDFILSASKSEAAGIRRAFIRADVFGNKTIELGRGADAKMLRCPRRDAAQIGYTVNQLELGDAARSLPAKLYRVAGQVGQSQGLVLFFHGGPAETLGYGENQLSVRRYLEMGLDVLAVEYSGSKGAGAQLSTRLKQTGGQALQADAAQIRRFLQTRFIGVKIILHGESFGALPAIRTEQTLGNRVALTVLVAPYLKHRSAYSRPSDRFYNQQYQADFELATIGIASSHASGETDLLRGFPEEAGTWSPNGRVVAIFGETDAFVRPSDLGDGPMIERVIVPRTGHDTVLLMPETWSPIRKALGPK